MFENLEVLRKCTYNIKSKSEQVTSLCRQESHHWSQLARCSDCEKEVSTFASQPLPSARVLDALIRPKDSHSSKPRCPGLNRLTPGWGMCITYIFSEMNTWCCQAKQVNIVGLSEVTQTLIVLSKTTNIRGCIGEINPTLWADLFKAKYF